MKTLVCLLAGCLPAVVWAAEEGTTIEVGVGRALTAPAKWTPRKPASDLIQNEFTIPAAEGDKADARATVMLAGGSVEANIDRWYAQFTQPDGSATRDKAQVEKKQIAGREVHLVDMAGTYRDARPMGPATERPGYRMLAAVIPVGQGRHCFVKLYGPEKTVAAQAAAFRKMIDGLK